MILRAHNTYGNHFHRDISLSSQLVPSLARVTIQTRCAYIHGKKRERDGTGRVQIRVNIRLNATDRERDKFAYN